MLKKVLSTYIFQFFCICWAFFLFADYMVNSSYFINAFKYIEYTGLILTTVVLSAIVTYLFSKPAKLGFTYEIKNFRPIYHYAFVLGLMVLIMGFYIAKTDISAKVLSGSFVFLIKTLLLHLGVLLILFSSLNIGLYILRKLPIEFAEKSTLLIALALGFVIVTFGIFILGIFNLLHQFIVIIFLLLLMIPEVTKTFKLVKSSFLIKENKFDLNIFSILVYTLLIFLIALNLILVIRPFPIGFDALNLYINISKLVAGYNGLVQGGDAYNWSLFMSLGLIIYKNTSIVLLLSVIPGILSIFALSTLCKYLKLPRNWSILVCAIFYSLPNTIWQSRNEEKVDLALLFISLCSILVVLGNHLPRKDSVSKNSFFSHEMILWMLSGCLIGYAFGIKYITMLSIFSFLVVLFYKNAGKYGALFIFNVCFVIIYGLDLTSFAGFEKSQLINKLIIPLVLSIIFLIITLKSNKTGLITASKKALCFGLFIFICFLPWAVKNVSENGNVSVSSIMTGKKPLVELEPGLSNNSIGSIGSTTQKIYSDSYITSNSGAFGMLAIPDILSRFIHPFTDVLFQKTDLHQKHKLSSTPQLIESNEKIEEIRRYLGYETGIIRFFSLPYDLAMKVNVHLGATDTGILALIILPIFMFAFTLRQAPYNLFKALLLILYLIISILSVQLIDGPLNLKESLNSFQALKSSATTFPFEQIISVYVFIKSQLLIAGSELYPFYTLLTTQKIGTCFMILTLIGIPIFFLYRNSLKQLDSISKSIIVLGFCILQYWLILSSGIIWYGIVGFSLVPVMIAVLGTKVNISGETGSTFTSRFIFISAAIWFILILPFQFMPVNYLNQTDKSLVNYKEFIDLPFAKYALGISSEQDVYKQFFTQAEMNILNTINRNKKAKVLNVATSLTYHITNNDIRVYKDDQLGNFKKIYTAANNDKTKLATEFKRNNIKYVLISLNAAQIDMTPSKTLTQNFDALMNSMINNNEIRLLYTNRLMIRPDGDITVNFQGRNQQARYDVIGENVLEPGTVALFEII